MRAVTLDFLAATLRFAALLKLHQAIAEQQNSTGGTKLASPALLLGGAGSKPGLGAVSPPSRAKTPQKRTSESSSHATTAQASAKKGTKSLNGRGAKKWHYALSSTSTARQGPVTKAAIVALVNEGKLQPADALVWRKGMQKWLTIDSCPEITTAVQAARNSTRSLSTTSTSSLTTLATSPRPVSPFAEDHAQAQLERFAIEKQMDEAAEAAHEEMLTRTRLPATEADNLEQARAKSPSTSRSGWPLGPVKPTKEEKRQTKRADRAERRAAN